jgi:hypothetical protein
MSRGSASAQTMEAEPPDMRYQAEPGNEYNHLGLLYLAMIKFRDCPSANGFSSSHLGSVASLNYKIFPQQTEDSSIKIALNLWISLD